MLVALQPMCAPTVSIWCLEELHIPLAGRHHFTTPLSAVLSELLSDVWFGRPRETHQPENRNRGIDKCSIGDDRVRNSSRAIARMSLFHHSGQLSPHE